MVTVEEKITDAGYEDVVVFANDEYSSAFLGVAEGARGVRAVYDYEAMVEWLMEHDGMTETDAIEWIEYNTLRALPYTAGAPLVLYRL